MILFFLESYERSIIDWKENDKVYLEIYNFLVMLEKVVN